MLGSRKGTCITRSGRKKVFERNVVYSHRLCKYLLETFFGGGKGKATDLGFDHDEHSSEVKGS